MTRQDAEIWLSMLLAQYGELSIFDILTKYTPDIFETPMLHSTYSLMKTPIYNLPLSIRMLQEDVYGLNYTGHTFNFGIQEIIFATDGVRVQQEWKRTPNYKLISYQEFFNLKDETV